MMIITAMTTFRCILDVFFFFLDGFLSVVGFGLAAVVQGQDAGWMDGRTGR